MHTRILAILSLICLGAWGCPSSPQPEQSEPEAVEQQVSEETPEKTEHTIAACTEGSAVPADATSCLLDLGAGTDSYWSDTDGIAPGEAGCHVEFETDQCATPMADGRTFGELCLDADRLVESNPGTNECHTHKGDMGKPDVVSCSAWCVEQGNAGGGCEEVAEAIQGDVTCKSARCVCAG